MIGAITLLAMNYVVVRFFFSHQKQLELLTGKATTLMKSGKIIRKNLDRELITEAELNAVARKQGLTTSPKSTKQNSIRVASSRLFIRTTRPRTCGTTS